MRLAYRWPDRRFNRARALVARLRRRSYGKPYPCGLLHEHPGRCVWFTPGDYLKLAAPLLHPLEPLPGPRVGMPDCPGCGRVVFGIEYVAEGWVVRDANTVAVYGRQVPDAVYERWLRFDSCGCERRVIVPATDSNL